MNQFSSAPEISIIIPTYNRAEMIKDTINSILNQNDCTSELIVIDDCSTDNTGEIIKSIDNQNIYYYKLQSNSGSQVARNFGSEKANADLLLFLDSDDILLPGSLRFRIDYFQSHPECESSYSDYEVCFKGVNKDYKKIVTLRKLSYREVLTELAVVPTSVLIIRSKIFNEIGKFDIKLPACHDDDIYIQCFKRNGCHYISTLAIKFINHPGQRVGTSINLANGKTLLLKKYKNEILEELGKSYLSKHYITNSIDYLFINNFEKFKESWFNINSKSIFLYSYFILEITKRIAFILGRNIRSIIYRIN